MNGFGERLRALRTAQQIPQHRLAEALEVSRSAVAMWERDMREPSLEMLTRLAALLHVTPDALLSPATRAPAPVDIHTRRVPLFTAGESAVPAAAPMIDAAEPDCDMALRITDDAMAPTLLCGDTLFLRRGTEAENGCIAAVVIDGAVCVKRIYRTGETCTLLSDNPRIPPMARPAPEILGVAVSYRRPLR